jgi:predicted dehydrogenase
MNNIVLGMVGNGRATELHLNALKYVHDVNIRYKTIMARDEVKLLKAKKQYGFENIALELDDLINDSEINIIDICTPPYAHLDIIKKALEHGKHVICEKPLTGYFGSEEDKTPIGKSVSKIKMFESVIKDIDELKEAVDNSDRLFMYAENFVYAPAIQRAAEIISAKKSKILYMKGEESLKGSSSPVAGEWSKTGGGTFIRTGSHPLSAILWLKQKEAESRGEKIELSSVIADMGQITTSLSKYEHRHISAKPNDVEDCGTVILTFSDNSKAVIIATDTLLGGSKNYIQLYCNDTAINCNLTLNNLMETYLLDEDGLENIQLSEMLPSKLGWNKPFVADELIRGYIGEMQDFVECVALNKKPLSGFKLAYDTVKTIYAAYYSAEQGNKVVIKN